MPNPAYLKLAGMRSIWEYNALSPKKKAEFQETMRKRLAELHESDPDGYADLQQSLIDEPIEMESE